MKGLQSSGKILAPHQAPSRKYPSGMRKSCDVVVVGAGVMGCALAAELAGLGAAVLLLERAEIAHGASGRNHGLIFYPQNPLTDPLYRESHAMYRRLAAEAPLDLCLDEKPCGFLVIVAAEEDWGPAEAEAMACREGGVRVQRLDGYDIHQAEPHLAGHIMGGWFIDDGYRLDPQALTLALALAAGAAGAEVATGVDVKQVLVRDGRVAGVATDQGVVQANTVVLAGGPWAPKLARSAGVRLPICGARGWLLLADPGRPLFAHLVESAGWHLTAGDPGPAVVTLEEFAQQRTHAADVGLLIQQSVTGHVLLGGSRIPSLGQEPEGPEVAREIARRAVAAAPVLGEAGVRQVWSGVRPVTPDGVPILGWIPEVDGLFVAGGHGGQGVMLGGGSGRLAAQVITHSETFIDAGPFRPDRPSLRVR